MLRIDKSLALIWVAAVVAALGCVLYVNHVINSIVEPKTSPAASTYVTAPLTVRDTGYSSATDLLQTAAGTFVYQGNVDFVQ